VNAVGGFGDDAIELLHLGRATDDAAKSPLGLYFLAEQAVFGLQLQVAHHALQQHFEFDDAERLGHIVVGAIPHGLHRRLNGAAASHHDDDGLRAAFSDAAQSVESNSNPVSSPL
jgi:hypothetical protein